MRNDYTQSTMTTIRVSFIWFPHECKYLGVSIILFACCVNRTQIRSIRSSFALKQHYYHKVPTLNVFLTPVDG